MKVYFSKASKYVELDRVRRILQEFHDHVKYLVLFLGSSTLRLGEVCPRTVGSTNSECIPKWQEKEMTCQSYICGANRCWPKGEDKPDAGSIFCTNCCFAPSKCEFYYINI